MSVPVKFSLFFVAFILVLAVAFSALIKTQITPEKVRETLLPFAARALDREVDFGAIEIGLFTGITVADLKVMQKEGTGVFFSVAMAELHYQFWPLLRGQVVVDKVLLMQPEIHVTRLADGRFNFSDLLPVSTENKQQQTLSEKTVATSAKVFNLLVKDVSLTDGELFYVDRFKNASAPFRYALKGLNFKARQITPDSSFPIDLSAVLNGSNIDVSGHYTFSNQTGDLTVHLAPLDLIQFAPYYRDHIPGKLGGAQLALNLDIDLQPEAISSKGKIRFNGVDLVLDEFPAAAISGGSIGADYSIDYRFDNKLLSLSTLLLKFNDVNLGAEGEFDLSGNNPFLVFSLLFDHLDLRKVMQSLPQKLSRDYQKYSLAGFVDGRVDFSGRAESGLDLLQAAKLKLTDVRASAENLRAGVSGDIVYDEKTFKSDNLQLEYAGQQLALQINAEKLNDGLFHGQLNVVADTLDLNNLFPAEKQSQNPVGESSGGVIPVSRQKTVLEDVGPYTIPAVMTGALSIKHLKYKQLDVSDVRAGLQIHNNRLSVANLKGQIGRGQLLGGALVDFGVKGLAYTGHIALNQPDIALLLAGLFPQSELAVSGQLHWQGDFSGRGTITETALGALHLQGDFTLQDGEATGTPLLERFAMFLGNDDLKLLSFKQFEGEYRLAGGLARFNAKLDSSKTQLLPHGSVTTDGVLDIKLDARFAPEVVAKLGIDGKLKETLTDQNGWGRVPLRIAGTLDHPKFSYDTDVLQQQIVDKASAKILEKIAPNAGEEAEPLREMLDNTLNKLFGK